MDSFPWISHLTIWESDMVERARNKFGEEVLLTKLSTGTSWQIGDRANYRSAADIIAYLKRNPRKPKEAA